MSDEHLAPPPCRSCGGPRDRRRGASWWPTCKRCHAVEQAARRAATQAPSYLRTEEPARKLPVEPFAQWLARKVNEYGTVADVAKETGMDEGHVRQVLSGEAGRYVLDRTVDEALTTERTTALAELYDVPELADPQLGRDMPESPAVDCELTIEERFAAAQVEDRIAHRRIARKLRDAPNRVIIDRGRIVEGSLGEARRLWRGLRRALRGTP